MKKDLKKVILVDDILVGSDPEMFLFSEEKNKYIPVCGLVGGTKDSPLPITDQGHAIQEDGVAVEFCIPPCKSSNEFVENINFVKNYINNTVLKPIGLVAKCVASARFPLNELPNGEAVPIGCDPDYNAYTLEQNMIEKIDFEYNCAGAHIHVGYKNPSVDVSIDIIKAMDLFLGVQSVLLDNDTERRSLYGKAGSYRFKLYGVEYRTLSNFWIENDTLIKWAYDQTIKAIDFVNNGEIITNPEDIINCINNCNKELATEILEDYNIEIFQLV